MLALVLIAILGFVVYVVRHKKDVALVPVVPATNTAQPHWEGTWTLDDSNQFYNSQIIISNVQKDTFLFEMNAEAGADVGELNNTDTENHVPTVFVSGTVANITDDTFGDNGYSYEDKTKQCILRLELQADKMVMSDGGGACDYGAGFGVTYTGTYHRGADIAQRTLETSDFFVAHKDAYPVFKNLVGQYSQNFDNFAMAENDTPVPELHADSAEFWVAHAANTTSMIIVAPGNKIWAGVPDYHESKVHPSLDDEVIRYFTNVPGYENKMPAVMQKWVPKEDKILYMSGKDKSK